MRYRVIAKVRKRGAIGVFYNESFFVEISENATRSELLEAWNKEYSKWWELHHIETYCKE